MAAFLATSLSAMVAFSPAAIHLSQRTVNAPRPALQTVMSADPFTDPIFTGAAAQTHTTYHIASSPPPGDHSTLLTGVVFYLVTMAVLTGWEEFVVPKLQDAGLLPEIPGTIRYIRHQRLSKEGRKLPWATPLTSDRTLPTLAEILQRAVRVSGQKDVVQLIRAHVDTEVREPQHEQRPTDGVEFEADELCAVCRVSPEFSDHYGQRVYLCKRMVSAPALAQQ